MEFLFEDDQVDVSEEQLEKLEASLTREKAYLARLSDEESDLLN